MSPKGEKDRTAGVCAAHGWDLIAFRKRRRDDQYEALIRRRGMYGAPGRAITFIAPLPRAYQLVSRYVIRESGVGTGKAPTGRPPIRLRIIDLLYTHRGRRVLLETNDPLEVRGYYNERFVRGRSDWRMSYSRTAAEFDWHDLSASDFKRLLDREEAA